VIAASNALGIVLAGGQSRRMGQDKALLKIAGKTLLERSMELLRAMNLSKVLVSGHYSAYLSVPDIHSDIGPLGGLLSVMQIQVNEQNSANKGISHLLILPVDMPLMTSKPLFKLLDQDAQLEGCAFHGSLFPMLIKCSPENLAYLQGVAAGENGRSAFAMIKYRQFRLLDIEHADESLFYNSNTPEQWQTLCPEPDIKESGSVN